MGRTAVAWGSIAALNLATYSQSELGFASNFNIIISTGATARAKRIPGPHGHTRGQVNCAMAHMGAHSLSLSLSEHVLYVTYKLVRRFTVYTIVVEPGSGSTVSTPHKPMPTDGLGRVAGPAARRSAAVIAWSTNWLQGTRYSLSSASPGIGPSEMTAARRFSLSVVTILLHFLTADSSYSDSSMVHTVGLPPVAIDFAQASSGVRCVTFSCVGLQERGRGRGVKAASACIGGE